MTEVCPTCGKSPESCYRCQKCGKDLVGSETEESEDLMADGGVGQTPGDTERRTTREERHDERPPFVDATAEYAECYFCGQTWDPTVVDGFDLSKEDEYYPKMVPVCPEHAGGCR